MSASDEIMLEKCVEFIRSAGIPVLFKPLEKNSFLPGLSIESGIIRIDKSKLLYPGDILHEAAHIAVVPAAERAALNAETIAGRENREAEEMMAIAWSYAACVHLGIDPLFVFHGDGYKGDGNYIAENFKNKQYFGLPMLQWAGLTADEKNAAEKNIKPYPHMIKWLRD